MFFIGNFQVYGTNIAAIKEVPTGGFLKRNNSNLIKDFRMA